MPWQESSCFSTSFLLLALLALSRPPIIPSAHILYILLCSLLQYYNNNNPIYIAPKALASEALVLLFEVWYVAASTSSSVLFCITRRVDAVVASSKVPAYNHHWEFPPAFVYSIVVVIRMCVAVFILMLLLCCCFINLGFIFWYVAWCINFVNCDLAFCYNLLLLVCVSFTIIGQPRNSVLIRRV